MEDTTNSINENLYRQSEKMNNTIGKIREIGGVLSSANSLIDRMTRR